jgi:hypothetical protein
MRTETFLPCSHRQPLVTISKHIQPFHSHLSPSAATVFSSQAFAPVPIARRVYTYIQSTSTGPYRKPYVVSPFPSYYDNLYFGIFPSVTRYSKSSLSFGFRIIILYAYTVSPCVLNAQRIASFLVWSPSTKFTLTMFRPSWQVGEKWT